LERGAVDLQVFEEKEKAATVLRKALRLVMVLLVGCG
jgi:hypothetical protein